MYFKRCLKINAQSMHTEYKHSQHDNINSGESGETFFNSIFWGVKESFHVIDKLSFM